MFANRALEMIQVALVFGDLLDHHRFAVRAGNRDLASGFNVFQCSRGLYRGEDLLGTIRSGLKGARDQSREGDCQEADGEEA